MATKKKLATSLDKAIDDMYKQKARISALAAKQKEAMDVEKELLGDMEDNLYSLLRKNKTTMAAGAIAKAQILEREIPKVEDWDALYKYVARTKNFELLGRSLAAAAVVERWDEGKEVPGVVRYPLQKLSLTKNSAAKKKAVAR